jgi:7-cyano-7-deazaguanine reductase
MADSSYENLQSDIRDWETPRIDTFENMYPDREYEINMTIPEFTCICPKTGLPDFATLNLSYWPETKCVELKSFKEYLFAYRDKGIFHENVVNKLVEDLVAAISPSKLRIEGVFNARGGIQTTVVRDYRRPD